VTEAWLAGWGVEVTRPGPTRLTRRVMHFPPPHLHHDITIVYHYEGSRSCFRTHNGPVIHDIPRQNIHRRRRKGCTVVPRSKNLPRRPGMHHVGPAGRKMMLIAEPAVHQGDNPPWRTLRCRPGCGRRLLLGQHSPGSRRCILIIGNGRLRLPSRAANGQGGRVCMISLRNTCVALADPIIPDVPHRKHSSPSDPPVCDTICN
jgi:hypothetical protein